MGNPFFDSPILNSPYERPSQHWELDEHGQPTQRIAESRRSADFVSAFPVARKRTAAQAGLVLGEHSTSDQAYSQAFINRIRSEVEEWRALAPSLWKVTPETARLLLHWRSHEFTGHRPFFCQIEAVETAIFLTEVAPSFRPAFIEYLARANHEHNADLPRLALKLATGAGKTTVMAMLIAWQTINAARRPTSKLFTNGFLVVTPGITIRDRLRVLHPHDPDSYYTTRNLIPRDMLDELRTCRIVITNFHAFKLRERVAISKGGRALLQGRGPELATLETEGQMLQRVMPELMGMKSVVVLNDEAHHCYREKPPGTTADDDEDEPTGDADEAQRNNETARLWISGLEVVARKLGVRRVFDLSATPFFLHGSGYREGSIFPWTMSDFSLMDAIECGIVKLPRIPVADNIPGAEMPMYRELWAHIGKQMPKKKRGESLDPLSLPAKLQTALEALYGHYEKTFELWSEAGITVPPCFIVVCQNTAISKLVFDYISGFERNGKHFVGRLALFRNYDEHGNPLPRPNTLLIDSEQLESGEALDESFKKIFAGEIERFRREILERGGEAAGALHRGRDIDDVSLLREVMNTVGKADQLGASIRCVVSVSMLTEGWDANTVTHVLGVRAFGTQLLCEQVIGRALRRQSYDLNEHGRFNVEYADVLGIPFNFTAKPVSAPVQKPRETVHVRAVSPERDALEIRFPRVAGYRVELPTEKLKATFTSDSVLELTPDLVGATATRTSGIIGESADLDLDHLGDMRPSTILYELVAHLVTVKYRENDGESHLHLFGQLKRIAREWLDKYLVCKGGTYPAQLRYKWLADMACEKIIKAISRAFEEERPITAILDPYKPAGTTADVNFTTSREERWQSDSRRCHVNWVILDSGWEGELCRVIESHPRVRAYVKNHSLGLEVPYVYGSDTRTYRPDFIVVIDDGRGDGDLLHLVIEIKGYRREDAKEKKATMETYWIPAVNHSRAFGRWGFAEFTDGYAIADDFQAVVASRFDELVAAVIAGKA